MSKLVGTVAVAVALSLASAPPPASACMNGVTLSKDASVRRLRAAELQLRSGRIDHGLLSLTDFYTFTGDGLQRRAEQIVVAARLRRAAGLVGKQRASTMEYETDDLRAWADESPDDPVVLALLAEALVLEGDIKTAEEARTLIEDLVSREVVPDAAAWVVVATVRYRAGDAAGHDAAIARCKAISGPFRARACRVIRP